MKMLLTTNLHSLLLQYLNWADYKIKQPVISKDKTAI